MKAEALIGALTLKEKISLLSETAPEIKRMGIPRYHHGNEALHGVVRPGRFTVFPQAIGMGASFNPELLQQIAEAVSDEARARHNENNGEMAGGDFDGLYNGLLTFWSPNLNTARDPRWGRTGETYGEDPYLAGVCGVAYVKGLQGCDEKHIKTVAAPKHFVGNNEEHNRFECDAQIPRKQYFEYYLKPFEMAVKEGKCESIMAAYNGVNGIPCHGNKELLKEILRERWGFEGYVVSDCGAVSHLLDRHKFVKTPQEAAACAIKAGVDLECGSCGSILHVYENYLKAAVEEGLAAEEDIDQAAVKVLKAREKLGILGREDTVYDSISPEVIGCGRHQKLAEQMAEESLVLLKNEKADGRPILPLQAKSRICVIGPQADKCQFGDYSGQPVHKPITILEGLREQFPEASIQYVSCETKEKKEDFHTIGSCFFFHKEDGIRKPGIKGVYQSLKDIEKTGERIDKCIDFEWENMAPDPLIQRAGFDICWEGILIPAESGIYRFTVKVNGRECTCKALGVLEIDNKPANAKSFEMEAGKEYELKLEYHNRGEHPSVSLLWQYEAVEKKQEFERETEAASQCDVVIACLGLGTEYEAEGRDKMDLSLPKEQTELLQAVHRVNPNLVVTLYNGSSLVFPWVCEHAKGILECWYPGEQGGRAIARVLKGEVCPSGRLPLTFYRKNEDLPPFDCYDISRGFTYWYAKEVQYPFGYGLSYTSYTYSDLQLEEGRQQISGSCKVRNTGDMAGYEVVQIYVRWLEPAEEPMKLSWIRKVWLEPGEEKQIRFEIPAAALERYDEKYDCMRVWSGGCEICVAKDGDTPLLSCKAEGFIPKER